MVARHDEIGIAGDGALHDAAVIGIGGNDREQEFRLHDFRYPNNELQLRRDIGFRPSKIPAEHFRHFPDDRGRDEERVFPAHGTRPQVEGYAPRAVEGGNLDVVIEDCLKRTFGPFGAHGL